MEAAYLCLFEEVGKGLCLLQCDLKMILCGFPLTRRRRRDARDRLREAEDRPKRHRSNVDQVTGERVKQRSLRMLKTDRRTSGRPRGRSRG